ncbi:hypothetical protein FKM82_012258 [Ascaphus truei]
MAESLRFCLAFIEITQSKVLKPHHNNSSFTLYKAFHSHYILLSQAAVALSFSTQLSNYTKMAYIFKTIKYKISLDNLYIVT